MAPRRSHAFLFVVHGIVGQRMALSLQPKAFTPVLHDVRSQVDTVRLRESP